MSIQQVDNLYVNSGIVVPKGSGAGIKIDPTLASPDFGWKDLIGQINPHVGGGTAPASSLIRGTATHIRAWSFTANQVIDDVTFHMPHDYVPGTDIFAHIHWTHSGTSISGNLVMDWYVTYCKGYNQASQTFAAEKNITQTIPTANVAAYPQYGHFIEEFQLSSSTPDATHIDRALLEVDGLLKIGMVATTVPTINGAPGGSVNAPFILMVDLHYQATGVATKGRNYPNFYV
jgi:hypothetical protein